jgi:hypothetical protein
MPTPSIELYLERWLSVIGYEGVYEVSNWGKVRRIAPWFDGRKTQPKEDIVGKITKSGYRRVSLQYNGKPKEFAVHRLVAAAFIGPLPSSVHQVNHKNGERSDNRLENLEYLTPSENQLHACRVLHRPSRPGSKHPLAKLKEIDVIEMRALHSDGWTGKDIAAKFGVSAGSVCWILKRKTWSHI